MEVHAVNDKIDLINGISPEGYPKFAFWFDELSKKYSIENVETKMRTEPFVDEVILSPVPLETWTADYVVVRIDDKYHLADSYGNCFFISDMPFIICRNVFVSGDKSYIITKNRVKKECEDGFEIYVVELKDYKFAAYRQMNTSIYFPYYLIKSDGERNAKLYGSSEKIGFVLPRYYRFLTEWYVERYKENACSKEIIIFNRDFEVVTESVLPTIRPNYSKTYSVLTKNIRVAPQEYYSTYFHSKVKYDYCGYCEIVEHNGKTYFFKSNGDIEETDGIISGLVKEKDYVVYRQGNKLVWRDLFGDVIRQELLTHKELYLCKCLEEIKPNRL